MTALEPDDALPFTIVFDGGSLGNPGRGYGSYVILRNETEVHREQLTFDHIGLQITNNQAEYRTLIGALERLLDLRGPRARATAVHVLGDSLLVISQLRGQWKVKNADLRPLFEQARSLLSRFGRVDLQWHDRANSVRLLGH